MKKEIYEKIKDDLPENLKNDVEKDGLGKFSIEILDSTAIKEEHDAKQKEYISKLNTLEPDLE